MLELGGYIRVAFVVEHMKLLIPKYESSRIVISVCLSKLFIRIKRGGIIAATTS